MSLRFIIPYFSCCLNIHHVADRINNIVTKEMIYNNEGFSLEFWIIDAMKIVI